MAKCKWRFTKAGFNLSKTGACLTYSQFLKFKIIGPDFLALIFFILG